MLPEEKEHYETLTGAMTPLRIARIEEGEDAPAFILSLGQQWLACHVMPPRGSLWITGAESVGGMSGSPIIDRDGRAIGLVCTGSEGAVTPMGRTPPPLRLAL
jgi:hypothetical protein